MREKKHSRKAFDICQVRAVVQKPYFKVQGSMVCAKYPTSFAIDYGEMEDGYQRGTLAITLGCLACPYRKAKLETGESAIEAITRLSSQKGIEQLNRLLGEPDAPESPHSPDAS